jgi:alpha-D-xyloside xylohydrolase
VADQPDFTKAESHIDYEYLGDTKKFLPKEFNISKGMIRWQGTISGSYTGVYKFRFTYGGYCKVWMNDLLLFDGWRQAWNPGLEVVNIRLEKDKKYNLKIEWIPDGGESYISAKWLPPVAEQDRNSYTFSSEAGRQLDYYFIYGDNMDAVIAGYRKLTGKATIVPKWAMGFWQSRERYKTEDEVLSTMKTFREKQIPVDNIVLDWNYWKQEEWGSQEFDPARFPSPDSMISALHKNYHAHFMISVWPKFYEGISNYNLFEKKGWLYKRNVANRQRDWIGEGYVSTFYDAFNADARKGFWDLLEKNQYAKGVDAWWMDASEPDILSNVNAQLRKEEMTPTALGPAAAVLNAYPLYNAKGIYEGQRAVDPNKRVFILTRSGFAGSQHYGAAIWSGDIASRWENMKDQIAAGVNFSMSGIPYWTMDIGGFAVEHWYENATGATLEEWRELNTRWYQFGAFCPLFRVHGQFPFREIFNIAPENHPAYKSMLYYDKLRYRLMPYIYSLAGWTYHKDYTIMRGLAMDFPDDSLACNLDDEYMFGPLCSSILYILIKPLKEKYIYQKAMAGMICIQVNITTVVKPSLRLRRMNGCLFL